MNFEWLLSQVISYVNRFQKAIASPSTLISQNDNKTDSDKEITEAMIFMGLSVAISSVGFDYLFGDEVDFSKVLMSFALLQVLMSVIATVGVFVSWRLARSNLAFDVFLCGTAYFVGVTAILNLIEAFVLLGLAAAFQPASLPEAKLAIWSLAMNPLEIMSESFPENNWDWMFFAVVVLGNLAYLFFTWWRTYRDLSQLKSRHALWAFFNYINFSSLVFGILWSFTIKRT